MMVTILAIVFANEAAGTRLSRSACLQREPRALYLRLKSVLDRAMGALLGALGIKLLVDAGRGT